MYAVSVILALAIGFWLWKSARQLPLPPGPKPKLFVGNVHQLPRSELWTVLREWSKAYSEYIGHRRLFLFCRVRRITTSLRLTDRIMARLRQTIRRSERLQDCN